MIGCNAEYEQVTLAPPSTFRIAFQGPRETSTRLHEPSRGGGPFLARSDTSIVPRAIVLAAPSTGGITEHVVNPANFDPGGKEGALTGPKVDSRHHTDGRTTAPEESLPIAHHIESDTEP